MIEPDLGELSVARQCDLLDLAHSSYYYKPCRDDAYDQHLMRLIDEEYTRHPFYGSPRMTQWLRRQGYAVNRKRVARLMATMGLHALAPGPHTSRPHAQHKKYPYLLKNVDIAYPNQVWSTDITYIRLARGFVYLVAVIDWFSRFVLAWELSNTMDLSFCLLALEHSLELGAPAIFNTDQGAQFTSPRFIETVEACGAAMSMDGKGRAFDNIFVERLWRSVKYEEVYLRAYEDMAEARAGIGRYFVFYNNERMHQSLSWRTPREVHDA